MKSIKDIGGIEGLFHIFVPGLFILFNFVGFIYLCPCIDTNSKKYIECISSNPTISIILTICFGYLFGVILRILKCQIPDNLSARKLFVSKSRNFRDEFCEDFPCANYIGKRIKEGEPFPVDVIEFYERVWKDKRMYFFNFCKILLISEDERIANEINTAEAYNRYISGMF